MARLGLTSYVLSVLLFLNWFPVGDSAQDEKPAVFELDSARRGIRLLFYYLEIKLECYKSYELSVCHPRWFYNSNVGEAE